MIAGRPLQYRDLFRTIVPSWLSDRPANAFSPERSTGFRYLYTFGLAFDAIFEQSLQSLRARFPGRGTPTALPYIESDRMIVRGLHESDAAFAARCIGWLDTWSTAGNLFTAIEQLPPLFSPGLVPVMKAVTNQGVWYELQPDGSITLTDRANWDWDGSQAERWARSWIIVYSPDGYPWAKQAKWGALKWGSAGGARTWGTTATRDEAQTLNRAVSLFNGGHVFKPHTIVALGAGTLSPTAPEPDGNWGKFYKLVGDVAVRSRLATDVRFFHGAS